ncbi:ATP-binding protein [Pectobacterium actinidiae]
MSLRLRAVLIAGIALIVLWAAAAAWMLRDVHVNLDRALDERLAMSARMVSGLLERSALAPNRSAPGWTEAIRVSGGNGIACEIRSLRGEILAQTDSSPASSFGFLSPGYSAREVEGNAWRIYVLQEGDYQITTADRIDQRETLISEMLYATGVPFLIAVFGGLAALWIGIGRGLSPLDALRRTLRDRRADDTTPIDRGHVPFELRPVIGAMDGLLDRLTQTLAHQRAFTDAAAHELRTPLTAIDTHLQVIRLTEGSEAEASLSSAEEGVRRLRRTLDQMMVLARAEAPIDEGDTCESVLTVVGDVIDRMDEIAEERLVLSVRGTDAGTPMPKSMLETVIRNLVDNALRYSPQGSVVELELCFDEVSRQCCLEVADRGPGLNAEQAAQAGRRFWRGDQGRRRSGDGAGLGISIVRAITGRFGGLLTLRPREHGGLVARLALPLAEAHRRK